MRHIRTLGLLLLASFLLIGCQTFPRHKVHHSLLEKSESELPKRVLLMPMDVTVSELSAGGLAEEVPDWSKQAEDNLLAELTNNAQQHVKLELISLPQLTENEQHAVEQHQALYDTVGGTAMALTMMPIAAWEHKNRNFDYTLGSGLSFLADKTGADTALFIVGEDMISSSGRKAAFVVAAAFGVGLQMGHTVVIGGLVDLRSGDILWLNYTVDTDNTTLTDRADVAEVLNELFEKYPGLEKYRELKAANK